MLPHKTTWLTLGVFLLAFLTTSSVAHAEALINNTKGKDLDQKKWKVIEGFRSAKFGMNEKQLRQAITKDFNIPRSKFKLEVITTDGTSALNISVPDLLPFGGIARIGYVMGYKSKKLMHVNVVWGLGPTKARILQEITLLANTLRQHFNKKKYQKESFATNVKMSNNRVLVFRGQDEKGRMILLGLSSSKAAKDTAKKKALSKIKLKLSYMASPYKADVFRATKGKL